MSYRAWPVYADYPTLRSLVQRENGGVRFARWFSVGGRDGAGVGARAESVVIAPVFGLDRRLASGVACYSLGVGGLLVSGTIGPSPCARAECYKEQEYLASLQRSMSV